MGLRAEIFSNAMYATCSNGGISATHTRVTIVNASGPFEPADDAPPVIIEANTRGTVRAVPAVLGSRAPAGFESHDAIKSWIKAPGWWMAGGAYVSTSDSRLSDLISKILELDLVESLKGAPADLIQAARGLLRAGVRPAFYGAIALHDRKEH